MKTTEVQYTGYTIEIPHELANPFAVLSCMLEHIKFDHPMELVENYQTEQMVEACIMAVSVSIGVKFGGTDKLNQAVNAWATQPFFEKLIAVIETANTTNPYNYARVMFRENDTYFQNK